MLDRKKQPTGRGVAVGKSIEEIIVARRMNETVPGEVLTFPEITSKKSYQPFQSEKSNSTHMSRSVSDLQKATRIAQGSVGTEDVSEALARHCKSLQLKLEVRRQMTSFMACMRIYSYSFYFDCGRVYYVYLHLFFIIIVVVVMM